MFSHDGQKVAIAGQDGLARIYGCELACTLDQVQVLARQRVTRQLTDEERRQFLPD